MKKKIVMVMLAAVLSVGMVGCGGSGDAATTDSKVNAAEADSNTTPDAEAAEDTKTDAETADAYEGEISVVSREDGSGTRGAFIELFEIEEKDDAGNKTDHTTEEAIIANKTDVMLTNVAGDPYAIGYVSLGSLNDSVKALKINGVDASVDTIKDGSYEIARPFNIAAKEGASEAANDFIQFILSADGQKIVEENGYIQIGDNAEAFTSKQPEGKIVIAGSSSVTPVMEKLKEAYATVNAKAEIEIQQSDSTTGMQAAIEGTCDIGMASRELKDAELESLTATQIALDGIVVIANQENTMADLTKEQVKAIFTGETTEWEALAE